MSRPRIAQTDGQIGFHWLTETGQPIPLAELMLLDDDPDRLPATHLAALDDALIDAAGRFGELLGGGAMVSTVRESQDLRELHRVLDRLCHEYAVALALTRSDGSLRVLPLTRSDGSLREHRSVDVRAGQIVGTAQLIAIRARMALGMSGPSPLAGQLDDPSIGVVAGHGRMCAVDADRPWCGGRWVVQSQDGPRYPLTLSMLLFDSSGVNKEAALDEHRAALRAVTAAALDKRADPTTSAGAIEWLLYDWLMAHRQPPDSGAVEIHKDHPEDAEMIVDAAAAGAAARALTDLQLFAVPTARG